MVVVRIKLWPKGDHKNARLLGLATISFDGESLSQTKRKVIMMSGCPMLVSI